MFKFRKTINIFIITYNVFIWFSFAIGNILEVVKMIYSITFNQSIPLCNVKDSIVQLFSKWCVVLWRVPIPFQESIKIKLFRILQCYFPPPPSVLYLHTRCENSGGKTDIFILCQGSGTQVYQQLLQSSQPCVHSQKSLR